jgi:ubiquinone/menaquinone biosynthesis C-methylase UbiE
MGDRETGQVSEDAAAIYEEVYLPALFEEWCSLVIEAASIRRGDSVLDIACGTGALAVAVAEQIGPEGAAVGIDVNEGMLNIARSKSSSVEWLKAPAEALPFSERRFDSVVSQFGLMYFEEQENAISEMVRVLQPGGSLAVVVWDRLERNIGLAAEELLWQQVIGEPVDETPYRLGDKEVLEKLFKSRDLTRAEITTHTGTARFDSIKNWIHTGAKGWTDDDALGGDQLELLLRTAEKVLADYRTAEGTVAFPTSAHIVTARKRRRA